MKYPLLSLSGLCHPTPQGTTRKPSLPLFSPLVLGLWLLLFSPVQANGQNSGNFAHLVSITHVCGRELGAVEFALNGNPNNYVHYWTHGPTSLSLDNLSPGTYTLVVMDIYGCVETYTVEILELGRCEATYSLEDTKNRCEKRIVITVTANGQPIPEASLSIVWNDGSTAGLTRIVNLSTAFTYCASISLLNRTEEESCCRLEICIPVKENSKCIKENRKEVIVNEFNRNADGSNQFIEILVIGNAECGSTFDLRGMHVDDNNGYLIPANDFVDEGNCGNIGINEGYLSFAHASSWETVPVGSLILLYSRYAAMSPGFPANDPEDSDNNHVYVVAVEDEAKILGGTGTWDAITQEQHYDGSLTYPAWGALALSELADGAQVRYPDGYFSHGASLGSTPFAADNQFSLWISPSSATSSNCRFTGEDYLLKTDFTCNAAEDSTQSPGLANSPENEAFLSLLLNCLGERSKKAAGESPPAAGRNHLKAYPNPFGEEFRLEVFNDLAGTVSATIFSASGQRLHSESWDAPEGESSHALRAAGSLPPGMLLLQFVFGSGERQTLRLVRIGVD